MLAQQETPKENGQNVTCDRPQHPPWYLRIVRGASAKEGVTSMLDMRARMGVDLTSGWSAGWGGGKGRIQCRSITGRSRSKFTPDKNLDDPRGGEGVQPPAVKKAAGWGGNLWLPTR